MTALMTEALLPGASSGPVCLPRAVPFWCPCWPPSKNLRAAPAPRSRSSSGGRLAGYLAFACLAWLLASRSNFSRAPTRSSTRCDLGLAIFLAGTPWPGARSHRHPAASPARRRSARLTRNKDSRNRLGELRQQLLRTDSFYKHGFEIPIRVTPCLSVC